MFSKLEQFIAFRYTRAKRRNHFISFISMISILGIVVGVWALITVLSVMNGFERELRDRILGVASHIEVVSPFGRLADWTSQEENLAKYPNVEGMAPFINGQGMLVNGQQVSGTIIRGVDSAKERTVSEVLDKLVEGDADSLVEGEFNIIIGDALASTLRLNVGDKVTVVSPQGQITPAGLIPRVKRFNITGIFKIGMFEYDNGLALIDINDAAKLFRTAGEVDGVRLKLTDVFDAPQMSRQIQTDIGYDYHVRDWTSAHTSFFRALKIERRMIGIILFLIVAVAAFNIVSTMVMVVTDKQADIAIMRTLGLTPKRVRNIFIMQGTMIGLMGTLIGLFFGVLTALNVSEIIHFIENIFHTEFMPADLYLVSDFPTELKWSNVATICFGAFFTSLLATLYPAHKASKVAPADALKYE